MKTAVTFICVILLVAAFASLALAKSPNPVPNNTVIKPASTPPSTTTTTTTTIVATGSNNGNSNSQAGGLPALAARVQQLETAMVGVISQIDLIKNAITGLQNAITSLESAVSALQSNVNKLIGVVGNLANMVKNLQGQNNWAVVDSSGNVVRHSGTDAVVATKLSTGTYDVLFSKDVTGCAYVATIGDPGKVSASPGFITVSGGPISGSTNDVQVQTFDKSGTLADSAFHLYVSCP